MKEWLLKEEKNKVGRPKLADVDAIKKSKKMIVLSLLLCLVLSFFLIDIVTGKSPLKTIYHLTLEKTFGALENKDGFMVNYKYDDNHDYVMEFKVPNSVSNYSGGYKYSLYEMTKNEWELKKVKEYDSNTKSFKIKINSVKNQNKTWKIKLEITNAAKIDKSYAPSGWNFNDGEKNSDKYAYKVFTVKGYYSPVLNEEIKEAKKSKGKIVVSTLKENPRNFTVTLPDNNIYKIIVKYTDVSNKNVMLKTFDNAVNKINVVVPNVNKSTKVTFMIYGNNIKKLKLSNWKYKKDNNKKAYITNSYILKPENTYKD